MITPKDWIDISLTCNAATIQLLFSLLSSFQTTTQSVRLSTVLSLQRMVAKGFKQPADKLELLRVLDLGKVLGALEERSRHSRAGRGEEDEELEQFREKLGQLLRTLGMELLDLIKEVRAYFILYIAYRLGLLRTWRSPSRIMQMK